ncbi:MAG: hypothetical protein NTV49_05970 [Kiritimatiellaeota bacterium]|nr:hypothetical protein [Kiritimatiellota bacterium]
MSGRKIYPSSIAYYAIQRTKAGRRSGYAGELDALSSAARLQRRVQVEALEAPVGAEDEDGTLHDVLADAVAEQGWLRRDVRCLRERAACRRERRA